jgi:acyl-CoA thioesterase-2
VAAETPSDAVLPLTGQAAVDDLVGLLDLEDVEVDIFRGRTAAVSLQRVFGGQVAGQALVAATRTVPSDRPVHSLHAYFIRPGDPEVPIVYQVERVRDGRSFTTRRVSAVQHGKTIFHLSASFQVVEPGVMEHQGEMPDVPRPEDVPTVLERLSQSPEAMSVWSRLPRSLDVRYIGEPGWVEKGTRVADPRQRVWMRVDGKLPDDPTLHACALTYASDLSLLDAVLSTHGEVWGPEGVMGASLDHAVWFHRPFRADEWVLYDCHSPSASGARGLAAGRFFSADGQHIATVVQEGLLRGVAR